MERTMEYTAAEGQGREATRKNLPVAIIGAGPVGLVAAAHLVRRREAVVVLEAGAAVGASVREWGHVRLFTPWKYLLDPQAEALLAPTGWIVPEPDEHPTGAEYVERFLVPLSRIRPIAAALRVRSRVIRVEREATVTGSAFRLDLGDGGSVLARAVVDASGNWTTPNPLGGRGEPLEGEETDARILRGIPDVAGADRSLVAGQRVLVAGSGHSALHLLRELLKVQAAEPATRVQWIIRRPASRRLFGGGEADALPARGAMGQAIEAAVRGGRISLVEDFRASRLRPADSVDPGGPGAPQAGLLVDEEGPAGRTLGPFDRILVATGFRPDLAPTLGLTLGLDPRLEAPVALAPLVDPALHACGSVRPHGWRELAHPETGYFAVGVRSYGRAPTFLLRTGFEQVRSVVAHLAGDDAAAEATEWELPATGVCVTDGADLPVLAAVSGSEQGCCTGCGC
jgi:hypothetical protein